MTLHRSTEDIGPGLPQQQAMDRMYRLQRHIYDVSRRYYLLGRDRLVSELDVPRGGTVLEIGCGTGRNLIQVARRYPHASVFGFDISEEMLKSAGSAIARSELTGRIRFAQGDALTFDAQRTFGVASFDRVYISYTLSMIPQWKEALAHASSMLAPGGRLHIADFGQCEGLPQVFRTGLFAWLRLFHVEPRHDLRDEVTLLSDTLGGSIRFDTGHRGYDWHLTLRTADCAPENY
jgi:S-adenosylmethionine-diacylgycerolhomoserine-N-methlytransferase